MNNLLYLKIKQNITEEIKKMRPHERIPSRVELVKRYDVTRTTVDRAISELIGEGYLYARDGSGTYVAEYTEVQSTNGKNNVVNWGVILPNIMHDTYPGILRGVADVASENDINVVIYNTDNDNEKQANYIYKLIDSDVEGIIIVPAIMGETNIKPFKDLAKRNIPFVFCNRGVGGITAPQVISNSFYGAYIATKHLILQGYSKIAFVSRPLYSTSSDRYQGYVSALAEANIELDEKYVVFEKSFFNDEPGYKSTKKVLQNNPRPDAIFCFNDETAKGAYKAIEQAGLQVGKDIGVVGYDNNYICESLPVKLTSVKFKTYEIGTKAAEILLAMVHGEKIQKNKIVILQPKLVVRESCGSNR